jgi:hypothetical protein
VLAPGGRFARAYQERKVSAVEVLKAQIARAGRGAM